MTKYRLILATILTAGLLTCQRPMIVESGIPVTPSLEDRTDDGALYTPGTQSFLRESHWLEGVESLELHVGNDYLSRIVFKNKDPQHSMSLENYPIDQLVPRLNYEGQGDAFDAMNLMLAEYSRNSISAPVGEKGDEMAHFQTTLREEPPWFLEADYKFAPNPNVRPVRLGLINNCLRPGLWEISAGDRSGELYHAWFDMPEQLYYDLVAGVNQLHPVFVKEALTWKDDEVPIDLERLRGISQFVGETMVGLHREELARGFSSQDSRRKIAKGFAQVSDEEGWRLPENVDDLTNGPCQLTEFIEPGKYALGKYRQFDLGFLRTMNLAQFSRVTPKTSYQWQTEEPNTSMDYIEIILTSQDHALIIGNLPLQLLVPQEDFVLNGFGVGVFNSSGLAERRKYLLEDGPSPSYAYLAIPGSEGYKAINSHEYGLEQIFIRAHISDEKPWLEITLTSYERIVDMIKYRVAIPDELMTEMRKHAMHYISPLYFTYRDDNLR